MVWQSQVLVSVKARSNAWLWSSFTDTKAGAVPEIQAASKPSSGDTDRISLTAALCPPTHTELGAHKGH